MIYFLVITYIAYRWLLPKTDPHVLNIYFGVPGAGKTTFAAYLTRHAGRQSWLISWAQNHTCRFSTWLLSSKLLRRKTPVYSNVPITGAYQLDVKKDIGYFMITDAKVIIDEAGVEYNNRKFKEFPQESIYWYKYHRHYGCSVDVFSQSFDDMDITLKRLAQNYYVLKKSLLPFFIVTKKIRRKVSVDKQTHQIIDMFYFGLPVIDSHWIFSPPLWKLFNSYSHKQLPEKDWLQW